MKKICNNTDVENSALDFKVSKIIANHLAEIFEANGITDISGLGAIYYAPSLNAVTTLIDINYIEWAVKIYVNDENGQSIFYLCCYVVDNDTAVDVLMPESILDGNTLEQIESAVNRRDYYYYY